MRIWPVPPEASSVAGDATRSTGQRAEVGDVTVLVDEVQAATANKEVTATHVETQLRTLRRGAGITAAVIATCAPRCSTAAPLADQHAQGISIRDAVQQPRRFEARRSDGPRQDFVGEPAGV